MITYRIEVEFAGTRYHGWQEQKNARTVAGELRRAIEWAGAPEILDLGGSGRTDAGVHAIAQTAHLRLARRVDPAALLDAVNEHLPADIHLLAAREVPPRFHARHHAVTRSYLYQVSLRRTGLAKRCVWWVRDAVDAARMAEAAVLLEGRQRIRRTNCVSRPGLGAMSCATPSAKDQWMRDPPE